MPRTNEPEIRERESFEDANIPIGRGLNHPFRIGGII